MIPNSQALDPGPTTSGHIDFKQLILPGIRDARATISNRTGVKDLRFPPLDLIRTVLKTGGHLFVTVPNSESFIARAMGKRWKMLPL
jgi:hypothetical protein